MKVCTSSKIACVCMRARVHLDRADLMGVHTLVVFPGRLRDVLRGKCWVRAPLPDLLSAVGGRARVKANSLLAAGGGGRRKWTNWLGFVDCHCFFMIWEVWIVRAMRRVEEGVRLLGEN